MPRVYLSKKQKAEYEIKDLYKKIYAEMHVQKMTQSQLADLLGITGSAVSQHLSNMSFSLIQLLQVMKELDINYQL